MTRENTTRARLTDEQRAERAVQHAKKFLTNLVQADFFSGTVAEGLSLRLKELMQSKFNYYISANPGMRGPIGKLCIPHIDDFIKQFFDYQSEHKENMSYFDVCIAIRDFNGAAK